MKILVGLAALFAALVGLGYASRRIATHQPVLPGLQRRFNTQVHRINQS